MFPDDGLELALFAVPPPYLAAMHHPFFAYEGFMVSDMSITFLKKVVVKMIY